MITGILKFLIAQWQLRRGRIAACCHAAPTKPLDALREASALPSPDGVMLPDLRLSALQLAEQGENRCKDHDGTQRTRLQIHVQTPEADCASVVGFACERSGPAAIGSG